MSAPVITGPQEENKRQSQYAWLLLAIITLALFATAYLTRDLYEHPTRESDCDAIVDYAATCVRASAPQPTPPPSPISLYLGTLAAAILAVLLIHAAWSASVTKQANLVTAFSGTAPAAKSATASVPPTATTPAPTSAPIAAATPAPAPSPTAKPSKPVTAPRAIPANSTLPPLGPHVVESVDDAALEKPAPITIAHNSITKDMIAPPKAEPKKGVEMVKKNG